MELWISTSNKGKLGEYQILLEGKIDNLKIHSSGELKTFASPPETGKTFEENARIKARTMKAVKPGVWVIGEDSGLEVTALGGNPGIFSARYGGPHARDSENRAKVIKMLQVKGATDRSAQFKLALVAYSPTGEEFVFEGILKGQISKTEKGQMGFGYDSIFIPEENNPEGKTLAEMGPGPKNKISHRAKAAAQLIAKVQSLNS
ncbi:MAG: RdgB/HAM1 family non-canonical purine NTP pyrophosphatase [Pseudobdellovibrionaceae bacterium]